MEPNFPPEYDPGEPLQEERPQLTLQLEKPEEEAEPQPPVGE